MKIIYRKEKVLTTLQLANSFQTESKTIRQNYRQNSPIFIDGIDYFVIEGPELHRFKEENGVYLPNKVKSIFLWTRSGVLLHAKLMNSKITWKAYKDLLNTYFCDSKYVVVNENDMMQRIVDCLEEVRCDMREVKKASSATLDKVSRLEEKVDTDITKDCMKASDIAKQLNLYSRSELPHSTLIAAIAKKLKMDINRKNLHMDDDIVITNDLSRDISHWQVYYRPSGVEKIVAWFEANKDIMRYEEVYKRNGLKGKKGDIKEHGYKLNGIKFKVK